VRKKNASACRVVKKTAQIATESTYTEAEEKQKTKILCTRFQDTNGEYKICTSTPYAQAKMLYSPRAFRNPRVQNARIPASSMYQIIEK